MYRYIYIYIYKSPSLVDQWPPTSAIYLRETFSPAVNPTSSRESIRTLLSPSRTFQFRASSPSACIRLRFAFERCRLAAIVKHTRIKLIIEFILLEKKESLQRLICTKGTRRLDFFFFGISPIPLLTRGIAFGGGSFGTRHILFRK